MIIDSAKSAREFVRAWTGNTGALWHIRHAAESQRACAQLALPNRNESARHLAAAKVLDTAAHKIEGTA